MSVRRNDNLTSSVSHTEKREENRRKRWFYFNRKSCIAMALSAALLFTSVDGMTVRAEELGDIIPPAAEEENPDVPENQEASGDSLYLKNDEGAVIISSFKELQEEDSHIELEKRKTLEEVRKLMPETLTANVTPVSSTGEDSGEPSESETEPGKGEEPGEGEANPGEGEEQPGEGDSGDQGSSDNDSGDNGDVNEGEGGDQSGSDSDNGGDNEDNSDQDGSDSGNDDNSGANEDNGDQGGAVDANDVAAAVKSGTFAQDGQQWRLLVETGESGTERAEGETGSADDAAGDDKGSEGSGSEGDSTGGEESGSEGDSTGGEGSGSEGDNADGEGSGSEGDNTGGEGSGSEGDNTDGEEGGNEDGADSGIEDGNDGDTTGGDDADTPIAGEGDSSDTTEPSEDAVSPETVEVEVPVTWECENYDKDKLTTYTFVPKWDETEWFFEESEEHKIPTIEVVYTVPVSEVSTEKELAAAFAAGFEKIVLKNDIELTKTLTLPADADIELDGDGHKLTRGKATVEGKGSKSSETFLGIMIAMDGEDYTEDTYGTLTLKNITVDGGTEADRAGAPAILDRGNLIMDEGAVIKDNFNYGTYPRDEDEETILDYGGIQVYRELTLSADALVTENFADEFGGGVYLAGGATLYLYADVIVNNSVGEGHGYGADLYAAPGSTIYYDPSIDMEREGFYICEGVTLIPMGIMETDLTPVDDRREVYISIADDSGYSEDDLNALKAGLEELGYTIISSKRTDINTTDLRDWYVYDHYDIDPSCWGSGTEGNPPLKWIKEYGAKNEKRKFYPRTEAVVSNVTPAATTIAEWLERSDEYGRNIPHLMEHIYSWKDNGRPAMMFVGYSRDALIDFLFYDPQSTGDKVVDFEVDSSKVYTHTLTGSGFLVNTNVINGELYGYLVYYHYTPGTTEADSVSIYKLEGVDADKLHKGKRNNGTDGMDFKNVIEDGAALIDGMSLVDSIAVSNWATKMKIQIYVTPTTIEVRQQPDTEGSDDISQTKPVLKVTTEKSVYSGFGPLVAYTTDNDKHTCTQAGSFTYSNLRMYYTDPMSESKDMLNPLQEADFTQDGTQKYFINLLGNAKVDYNDSAEFGQYQEYMEMMQREGIGLITDRKTPFAGYLGESDDTDSNLVELDQGNGLLTVEELIEKIHESISGKTTTNLEDKLNQPLEEGGLSSAKPPQSVGNLWLKSGDDQVRVLNKEDFGKDGRVEIQIVDDIAYYHGNLEDIAVTYEVLKPGRKGYTTLGTVKPNTPVTFMVDVNDTEGDDWPPGFYTVRQRISNSSIYGYAYFELNMPSYVTPNTYPVNVNVTVNRDGEVWDEHGKMFKLLPEGGGTSIDLPGGVPAGTYDVYDVTGLEEGADLSEDRKGGSVTVENVHKPNIVKEVRIDYYTVTFYDRELDDEDKQPYGDGTDQREQFVLEGKYASRPGVDPKRDKYDFIRWVTADGTEFDFDNSKIDRPTDIFAKWSKSTYPVTVKVTAQKDGYPWNRQYKLRPEGGTEWLDLSVLAGNYILYDVTGLEEGASPTEDMNTGVSVEVEAAEEPDTEKEVKLEYYTVKFYDRESGDKDKKPYGDGTDQKQQIVLKDQYAARPANPSRDKYVFTGWVNADGTEFDFDSEIDKTTEVYASWEKIVAPRHKVTINDRKDGGEWENSGRIFALRLEEAAEEDDEEEVGEVVDDLKHVKNGTYRVYDISGIARSRAADTAMDVEVGDGDTGVTVTVKDEDATTAVDYYTVTFYDGQKAYGTDTAQSPMIVLNGKKASEPSAPKKTGYRFNGWRTEAGGSTVFDFDQAINSKTDIYAGWKAVRSESGKDSEEGTPGGGGSEDVQTITVRQEASPQAGINQPESASPSESEPKTKDDTLIEIYATVAMIAGLTYMLLYFMEEGRGMTEREKEVFVAAFIRWAKKGGRFRKCCAIVAIFCILVYYHSIGKRSEEKMSREYLKHAL